MVPGPRLAIALLLSLALSASAGIITQTTSPVTLALTKQFNLTRVSKILEADQARARALKARGSRSQQAGPYNIPLVDHAVFYSTTVGIGNPPQNFDLLIDTGSSNTWVGAQMSKAFVPTSATTPTGDVVKVMYGSGQFVGIEYTGTVHVGNVSIAKQGFGGALVAKGFNGIDGILGIGPVALTCGTLLPNMSKCIPTIIDNAFTQKLIDVRVVGISFVPSATTGSTNGELTLGGIDSGKRSGELTFVPITNTSPASNYVGINQTISYGDPSNVILSNRAGIVDTGTTLLLLASDAFDKYKTLTGAVMDNQTGLLKVTPAQFGRLRNLRFTIGPTTFDFIPNAQAWPRQLNAAIGGSPNDVYLIVGNLGSLGGEGLDFINGMSFLERFYHVYDSGTNQVGFAQTSYTYALIN